MNTHVKTYLGEWTRAWYKYRNVKNRREFGCICSCLLGSSKRHLPKGQPWVLPEFEFLNITIRHENITYPQYYLRFFPIIVSRFWFFWINFGQNYPISFFVEIVSENYPLGRRALCVLVGYSWQISSRFCPFFLLMSEQRMGCSGVSGPHRSCLLLPGMWIVEIAAILSALCIKILENCSISKCVLH